MGAVAEGNQWVFRIACHKKLEELAQEIFANIRVDSLRDNKICIKSKSRVSGLTPKQMNTLKHYLEIARGVRMRERIWNSTENVLSPSFTNNFWFDIENNSRAFNVKFYWSACNPFVFPANLDVKTIDGRMKINRNSVYSPYIKDLTEASAENELLEVDIPCKERIFHAYLYYCLNSAQGLPPYIEFSGEDLIEVLLLSEYLRYPNLSEYCIARLCRVTYETKSTIVFNIASYAKSERLLPEILRWIEASWDYTEESLKDQFSKVITTCTDDFLENLLKYAADQKLTNIQTYLLDFAKFLNFETEIRTGFLTF
jgi:hypothetical protein